MNDISNYNFEKGNIGEDLAKIFLEAKGYFIYGVKTEGSHPCDNIATKWDMNFRALDIKTYPRRFYFPDTGINYSHYEKYSQSSSPFYLIFVDDIEKKVYGNKLSELVKCITIGKISYPYILGNGSKKRIYFPLQHMELYMNLGDKICDDLRQKSNSGYYQKGKKHKIFAIEWKTNISWV